MLTIAYLANQFPAAVEPYVGQEIDELRRRGVRVIPGSVRRPDVAGSTAASEILCLQTVRVLPALQALGLTVLRWKRISDLVRRALLQGKESPARRAKALLHTWLGAYYAVRLRVYGVDHIHVHHGYFGAWIAMVAARLSGVSYSITLHGSDLLLNGAYLDTKLENCRFCVTISEYNRRYILEHFPEIDPGKIVVSRLGVDRSQRSQSAQRADRRAPHTFKLLAVGRLQAVKDHAFLVRACARLRDHGLDFECAIAGEGPERESLESLIEKKRLADRITLLGHVRRERMDALYDGADVVVLTSRSEGIPLVLMESMVRGKVVIAPAITGIPEIVIPGKTGFLYAPGIAEDFVAKVLFLHEQMCRDGSSRVSRLDWVRHAARTQVLHNFSRGKNLARFADHFLELVEARNSADEDFASQNRSATHEDLVLQQI